MGRRMGTAIPKQFLEIDQKPILMLCLEKFHAFDAAMELIVTLPENEIQRWKEICDQLDFKIQHELVAGGANRFDSVKNGLSKCNGDLIGVHDGVRPFVSVEVIKACYDLAVQEVAVIPVITLKESVRKVETEGSVALDRSKYRLVQTPQVFQKAVLDEAYQQEYKAEFTDDASVVEQLGYTIQLVDGNPENIKITTPFDLEIAKLLLRNNH